MARLSHAVAFNLAGRLVGAGALFLCTPYYVAALGLDRYAFVQVWIRLTALLVAADLGLPTALAREIARELPDRPDRARDALRTAEGVFAACALVLGGVFMAAAEPVARWLFADLDTSAWTPERLAGLVRMLACASLLQFVSGLYRAALVGQERQGWLNAVDVAACLARYGGGIVWLAYAARDGALFDAMALEGFFAWMALAALAQLFVFRYGAWRFLPGSGGRFSRAAAGTLAGVSAGLLAFNLTNMALFTGAQFPLVRWLGAAGFSAYALAAQWTLPMVYLSAAWYQACFPRFSAWAARGDDAALRVGYRRANRVVACTTWPVALMIAAFAREVLWVWTGDAALADRAAPTLAALALGQGLYTLTYQGYALAFARGRFAGAVALNALALAVYVPVLRHAATVAGGPGAGVAYLGLALFFLVALPCWAHHGERSGSWLDYPRDVGVPALYALAGTLAARLMVPVDVARWPLLPILTALGFAVLAATLWGGARAEVRAWLRARFPRR